MKPEDPGVARINGWAAHSTLEVVGSAFCLELGYSMRGPGGVPGARETNGTFAGTTD
jgi:hypothetical protein